MHTHRREMAASELRWEQCVMRDGHLGSSVSAYRLWWAIGRVQI